MDYCFEEGSDEVFGWYSLYLILSIRLILFKILF